MQMAPGQLSVRLSFILAAVYTVFLSDRRARRR